MVFIRKLYLWNKNMLRNVMNMNNKMCIINISENKKICRTKICHIMSQKWVTKFCS